MTDFMQSTAFSHYLLKQHIKEGDHVVDATAGNGHDTLFLAHLVGDYGQVYAFDIQEEALKNTTTKLQTSGIDQRVKLILDSHANMPLYLPRGVDAVLFNLGYLPGGDKSIITQTHTTLLAVQRAIDALNKGGLICIVAYLGHEGGEDELKALLNYTGQLDDKTYNVLHYRFLNQVQKPPQLLAINKRV